jgi:hypothetical protein
MTRLRGKRPRHRRMMRGTFVFVASVLAGSLVGSHPTRSSEQPSSRPPQATTAAIFVDDDRPVVPAGPLAGWPIFSLIESGAMISTRVANLSAAPAQAWRALSYDSATNLDPDLESPVPFIHDVVDPARSTCPIGARQAT